MQPTCVVSCVVRKPVVAPGSCLGSGPLPDGRSPDKIRGVPELALDARPSWREDPALF